MITEILKQAWEIYRKHFGIIASVVVVIWLPLNLLSSYMDYFKFDPEDFMKPLKFYQFLDNFVGIIATAGVISIAYNSLRGERPSFGDAMSVGMQSWGRMWWTRFLVRITILVGLILLIIPGIYFHTRLALVEPIAVCERISGPKAMSRSFELTKGRFWQAFLLLLFSIGLPVAITVCIIPLTLFIPQLDHWLVDAATSLFVDVIAAFGTLCLLCAYTEFSKAHGAAELAGTSNGTRSDSTENPNPSVEPPSLN